MSFGGQAFQPNPSDSDKQNQLAYSLGLLLPTTAFFVWLFDYYASRIVIDATSLSRAMDWLIKIGLSITVVLIATMLLSILSRGFWLAVRPYRGHPWYQPNLEQKYNRVADNLFSLYLFVFCYLLSALVVSFPLVLLFLLFQYLFAARIQGWLRILLLGIALAGLILLEQSMGKRFLRWIGLSDFLNFFARISFFQRIPSIRYVALYFSVPILLLFWTIPYFLYNLDVTVSKDIFIADADPYVIFDSNFGGEVRDVDSIAISVHTVDDPEVNFTDKFSVIGEPSQGHFKYYLASDELDVGQYQITATYPRRVRQVEARATFSVLPELGAPPGPSPTTSQ